MATTGDAYCHALHRQPVHQDQPDSLRVLTGNRTVCCLNVLPPHVWLRLRDLELCFHHCGNDACHCDQMHQWWSEICTFLSEKLHHHERLQCIELKINFGEHNTLWEIEKLLSSLKTFPPLAGVRLEGGTSLTMSLQKAAIHGTLEEVMNIFKAYGQRLTSPRKPSTTFSKGGSFPFERLPTEIQTVVLSHCTLVCAPKSYPLYALADKSYSCCGFCSADQCFCRSINLDPQWVSYSTACQCSPPRTSPLFAVNSTVRRLASELFYGQNKFVCEGTMTTISEQIDTVKPVYLALIKSISIRLAPSGHTPDDVSIYHASQRQKLLELLQKIKSRFSSTRLALHFDVLPSWCLRNSGCDLVYAQHFKNVKVTTDLGDRVETVLDTFTGYDNRARWNLPPRTR
ncbi:hypothetical protein BT63DRAFT_477453 [Microthyrium microscopicum]|uniref:Uncharacterized protein n=1 Tax=Microthyrium microscopicum TaxID=703497 RepID=A0A6A6UGD0_9PEZI|nr:hypothetical protein BT63DRAFT_477453 [Microthyrium microscopicum]